MASVKITTTIECEVGTPDNAHTLGQELEERLHSSISSLLPTLRNSRYIQSGTIHFSLEIRGRSIRIRRSSDASSDAQLQLEGHD